VRKLGVPMAGLLERLDGGVVLGAEGYLFELERRGYVKAGPYVPEAVLDAPAAVKQLHREFLRAGAEVMVAFTYYAHRSKVGKISRLSELERLNRTAVRLAAEVAAEGDALVAGNLSNTWEYDPTRAEESARVVRRMFAEQVRWSVQEGVDFFIGETFSHVGEAVLALEAIKEAGSTAVITFIPTGDRSLDGYPWEEACRLLEDRGADVIGLNCGRGPRTMYPLLERIRKAVRCPVAAQPVPYRTTVKQPSFQMLRGPGNKCAFPLALDPFLLTRFEMAEFASRAARIGVNYIGICCGGAPHHVRSMAEALGRTVPASRYSPDLLLHPFVGKQDAPCSD
jgi:betaine-homocysteine S-methyltransferase